MCRCVSDIRRMNCQAIFAKRTGMIILGGGLVKHHIANANLMVTPPPQYPDWLPLCICVQLSVSVIFIES